MKREEIKLSKLAIKYLEEFKSSGKRSKREFDRCNILLLLNKGKKDSEIEDFLGVSRITIWRTRRRYLEQGVERALEEESRSGQPRKYGMNHETEIIALACSDPPAGRARWTLELLTEQLAKQKGMETINRESIRLILKKTNASRG